MYETKLPSGLVLVESDPPPPSPAPPPPPEPTARCIHCNKPTYQQPGILGYVICKEGYFNSPTCKHAEFFVCKGCWGKKDKSVACPVCGCQEMYC
jgi:hypothetical protein